MYLLNITDYIYNNTNNRLNYFTVERYVEETFVRCYSC